MKNTIKNLATIAVLTAGTIMTIEVKARDCSLYTYDNTRTERQALHHKGLKSHAEKIVRQIEACEISSNGGNTVKQTQELHHSNDVEINARRSMNNYSVAGSTRY